MEYEFEKKAIGAAEAEYQALQQQVLSAIRAYSAEAGSLLNAMKEFYIKNKALLVASGNRQ